jgi:hypothetical protein
MDTAIAAPSSVCKEKHPFLTAYWLYRLIFELRGIVKMIVYRAQPHSYATPAFIASSFMAQ